MKSICGSFIGEPFRLPFLLLSYAGKFSTACDKSGDGNSLIFVYAETECCFDLQFDQQNNFLA